MRRLDYLLGFATVGLLAGCPSRDVSEVNPTQDKEEFKDIPVQLNRDLDLLFVIDNSGSMAEEQDNLTANLPVFINVLETIEGGLPNVHIGVISSDVGAGPFNIPGCSPGGDGGALIVNPNLTSCFDGTANYIEDISDGAGGRTTNYTGTLAAAFACNATLGSTGCGFEQHFESMRQALDGSNSANAGFLRDTAFLGVVFLADEDDCSAEDAQVFDTSQNSIDSELGFLASFRCNEFGVTCETGNDNPRAPGTRTGCAPDEDSQFMYGVQEYIDFLKSLKEDDNLIIVAGIMGPSEPYVVGVDNMARPAIVPACTNPTGETCAQDSDCSNQKVCVDGLCVSKADPSVRMTALLQGFPNRNASTTICNNDLSDGLALIAELLKEAIGNPCIEALLKDRNADTPELEYECTVSDVVNPNTDEQEETVLPFCNMASAEDGDPSDAPASTNLPCWYLFEDRTACPETPTGLTLVVERGDISVPTGTHVQARCVTCVDGNMNLVCDELE